MSRQQSRGCRSTFHRAVVENDVQRLVLDKAMLRKHLISAPFEKPEEAKGPFNSPRLEKLLAQDPLKDLFEPSRENELLSFHYKVSLQEALDSYLSAGAKQESKCDSASSSEREDNGAALTNEIFKKTYQTYADNCTAGESHPLM